MVRLLVDKGGLRGFHFCPLDLEKWVEDFGELGTDPTPHEGAKQVNSSQSL
jgi:hypothetical protein